MYRFRTLPLTAKILLSVGTALVLMLLPLFTITILDERNEIEAVAQRRAHSILDMLESVHVNSMLNRKQVEDNDPAVNTLNGTMEQFSEQNEAVKIWLVMGEKIMTFQTARGQSEVEGPLDSVDDEALATGRTIERILPGDTMRVTKPVILGQGSANNLKCVQCHSGLMGVEDGEVFGAYSAAVDMALPLAIWEQRMLTQVIGGIGVVLGILLLIYALLYLTVIRPLHRIAKATTADVDDTAEFMLRETERRDVLGNLARALLDFREKLTKRQNQLVRRTRQLEAAQESLVQQERLATLGELTATVSHELRNPLSAVRSSVHLAIKKTEGLELGVDRALERAERNVSRCDGIISDLLDYASEPHCQPEAIIGDEWLQLTLKDLEIPDGVALVNGFSAPDAQVNLVPERMRRAIVNVFENAMQGLADAQQDSRRVLTVGTFVQDGTFHIVFEDTGPGIDDETVAKVFEPLFSTKSYGCGLGLATTKKIIETHDGTIHFESEIGVGTKVTMRLPIARAHERAA